MKKSQFKEVVDYIYAYKILSRAPYFKASGRRKVEGSLIRLFKAKEGSKSIRVLAYLKIIKLLANLS
jgi:hypothetical protein